MRRDRTLKGTFGKVSHLYDSARAGYPEELIKDLIKISKINKNSKILDIGCGTGKATKLFARKGYNIMGIDISKELLDVAKENTVNLSNISYQKTSFEDFKVKKDRFDLVISAQAWHWIDPKIAYKKASEVLTNEGYLALFWKFQDYSKLDFLKELRKLYQKYCPKFHNPMALKSAEEELPKSKLFLHFERKKYSLEIEYSKEKYKKMVFTMSWVIALSEKEKTLFNKALSSLLEKQEETFKIPYNYVLLIAKKK